MAETTRLEHLLNAKITLIAYMKSKIELADWHAVSDCANDLREIDVEMKFTQPVVIATNYSGEVSTTTPLMPRLPISY